MKAIVIFDDSQIRVFCDVKRIEDFGDWTVITTGRNCGNTISGVVKIEVVF